MPKYRITAPDGGTYEITAPDGASEKDVLSYAQSQFQPKPKSQADFQPSAEDRAMADPTRDMSGFDKFAAGMGKSIVDAGRGVKGLFSFGDTAEANRKEVIDSRQRDRALMDTGAGFAGDLVGNIGMALAPGGVLKGASVVAKSIPATARVAEALNAAGSAAMAPKSIRGALAIGGAQGAIQPAGSAQERVANTLLGGAATAVVPAAGAAYRGIKAAVEPFYEGGRGQIVGRALRDAAGSGADDAVKALQGAKEIVPGSAPTAAEASGNAGIAAMQRAAEAVNPEVTNQYASRMAAQNQARAASIQNIAGTPREKSLMEGVRGLMSEQPYADAMKAKVPLTLSDRTASELMERPSLQAAWREAEKLAREAGSTSVTSKGEMTGESLHYLKLALDDQIGAAKSAGKDGEVRLLMKTRDELRGFMEKAIPQYKVAREAFSEWSKPINAMDVGQAFADKSSALTGRLRPEQFAAALRNGDDIAAKATGFQGATLEKTLDARQISAMNAIKEDLARSEFAKTAGRGVGSNTVQNLAYGNILDRAGVPTFLRSFAPTQIAGNLAARGADAVYSRANKQIAERLAMGLLDPQEAAKLMQSATASQRAQIAALIAQRSLTPLAMSTPALLNASQ